MQTVMDTRIDGRPAQQVVRNAQRRRVRLSARLRQSGAKGIEIDVHDLSTHGFQVDTVHVLRPDQRVWLQFAGFAPMEARVRWFRDYRIGCSFETPLHPAVFDAIVASARVV